MILKAILIVILFFWVNYSQVVNQTNKVINIKIGALPWFELTYRPSYAVTVAYDTDGNITDARIPDRVVTTYYNAIYLWDLYEIQLLLSILVIVFWLIFDKKIRLSRDNKIKPKTN